MSSFSKKADSFRNSLVIARSVATKQSSFRSSLFYNQRLFGEKRRFLLHKNRQILYTAPFWKPLYTCFRAAAHGSKPRDIALHTVCCNETIYVSLRDATN